MSNNNQNFDNTTEENFLKNKAKRKKQVAANINTKKSTSFLKVLKIIGIVFASLIAAFVAVIVGLVIYYISLNKETDSHRNFAAVSEEIGDRATQGSDSSGNSQNGYPGGSVGNYKYHTFLATATDYSGNLTDVIMIARLHYSESDPYVSVLQIPRDTYVKMSSQLYFNDDGSLSFKNFDPKSGTYVTKINGVYAHGKSLASSYITSLLKDASGKTDEQIAELCNSKKYKFLNADVEKVKKYVKSSKDSEKKDLSAQISKDFGITYLSTLIYYYFGIPIDYQAQVNLSGFRGIVNAIGGVDLTVPRDMDYDDSYQNLHIHLKKGYQHLDGDKAEQFVRFRSYTRGDVDRLDAQKLFINAFLEKLLSPSTVSKMDDIMVEIQENLYTSISFNDMLRFSKCVLNMELSEDVKLYTLPGVGGYVGEVSYFIPYKSESIKLINSDFNVYENTIENKSFNMIDYNDVVSGEKPAIGPSTIDQPSSSGGSEDDTVDVESNDDETNEGNSEVSDETTENSDEADNSENSEEDGDDEENAVNDEENGDDEDIESGNVSDDEENGENDIDEENDSDESNGSTSDDTEENEGGEESEDENTDEHEIEIPEANEEESNTDENASSSDSNIPILDSVPTISAEEETEEAA